MCRDRLYSDKADTQEEVMVSWEEGIDFGYEKIQNSGVSLRNVL